MENKKKPVARWKKILRRILLGILTVILILVITVSVIAARNVKVMNHCVDAAMETLRGSSIHVVHLANNMGDNQ